MSRISRYKRIHQLAALNTAVKILYSLNSKSNYELGAVLSQLNAKGMEHAVSYASRIITKAEWNYYVIHKQ